MVLWRYMPTTRQRIALLCSIFVSYAYYYRHRHQQISLDRPDVVIAQRDTSNLTVRWDVCEWDTLDWNKESTSIEALETSLCQKAFTSGSWLQCMLKASEWTPSKWTDPNDLSIYGWNTEIAETANVAMIGVLVPLMANRISIESAAWRKVTTTHQFSKNVNGRTYWATKGKYQNYINLDDGAVLAYYNYGPDTVNGQQVGILHLQPDDVVPLKQWSDIMFLDWKRECKGEATCMKRLQHIFRVNVVNRETVSILKSIAGADQPGADLEWPGIRLTMDDPRALAMLGTPNGNGIAWFLGQHKAELGHKIVDRVNVFNCDNTPASGRANWCMYFHIVDA